MQEMEENMGKGWNMGMRATDKNRECQRAWKGTMGKEATNPLQKSLEEDLFTLSERK